MLIRIKKAQSTAEYAIILGVVISAAVAMQVYIKRGLQARTAAGVNALTQPSFTMTAENMTDVTAEFKSIKQYEPYYLESQYQTQQASKTDINVNNDYVANISGSEISGRGSGGFSKQHALRDTADNLWEEER